MSFEDVRAPWTWEGAMEASLGCFRSANRSAANVIMNSVISWVVKVWLWVSVRHRTYLPETSWGRNCSGDVVLVHFCSPWCQSPKFEHPLQPSLHFHICGSAVCWLETTLWGFHCSFPSPRGSNIFESHFEMLLQLGGTFRVPFDSLRLSNLKDLQNVYWLGPARMTKSALYLAP